MPACLYLTPDRSPPPSPSRIPSQLRRQHRADSPKTNQCAKLAFEPATRCYSASTGDGQSVVRALSCEETLTDNLAERTHNEWNHPYNNAAGNERLARTVTHHDKLQGDSEFSRLTLLPWSRCELPHPAVHLTMPLPPWREMMTQSQLKQRGLIVRPALSAAHRPGYPSRTA